MKESIQDHKKNIKNIKKALNYDKKFYQDWITKRMAELEFYEWQVKHAEKHKKQSFDRNSYMVK